MKYVMLNNDPLRWEHAAARHLYRDLYRFPGSDSIPDSYRRLCDAALANDWDHDTIVMQDDVVFNEEPSSGRTELLLVHGFRRPDGHVCPHAFSASREGWQILSRVWLGHGKVCRSWRPVVESVGKVLNITSHVGKIHV